MASTEPLWSVLETGVRNRSPPPTSLKQLEGEGYNIPLGIDCLNLVRVHLRLYSGKQVVQHHINNEMCTVSAVISLFCPTPVRLAETAVIY
jgi:hypothetical protein